MQWTPTLLRERYPADGDAASSRGAPALEAELYDGSDVIDLIWLGRRKIAGIEPGRLVLAEGLVSIQDGRKVMFNPRYELRPTGGA